MEPFANGEWVARGAGAEALEPRESWPVVTAGVGLQSSPPRVSREGLGAGEGASGRHLEAPGWGWRVGQRPARG